MTEDERLHTKLRKATDVYPIMVHFGYDFVPDRHSPVCRKFAVLALDLCRHALHSETLLRLLDARDCALRTAYEVDAMESSRGSRQ